MKLQFDPNQEYQMDAVRAVTDLFDGLPLQEDDFSVSVAKEQGEGIFATQAEDVLAYGNHAMISDGELLNNLKQVQIRNGLDLAPLLQKTHIGGEDSSGYAQFSVEMETATGKTYVYLRTIQELHQKYGYSKFVVVVPGKAIREGTLKNLEITKDHFQKLYGNQPFWHGVYDSKNMSVVRDFAMNSKLSILVINIEAFRKDFGDDDMDPEKGVLFHRPSEKLPGNISPREFIQAVHPILIIDEPQSVDNTPLAKKSISLLNPLFTLRYSATHRNPYNLVYRLDPIKAYEMRLVKKVSVAEVLGTDGPGAGAYVKLLSVSNDGGIKASLEVDEQTENGPKRKKVTIKNGEDLYEKTKRRDAYQNGFMVGEINASEGREYIQFEPSGIRLNIGEAHGGDDEAIKRLQIRKTVEEHFEKELELQGKGIKVLSLFFLDRVANYREYPEEGEAVKGLYAKWFEEEYNTLRQKARYAVLEHKPVEQVHDGYFAEDKTGQLKDSRGSGDTSDDETAYNKIMKEKERLLSLEEPLKFIFSHSALREGWDNPNVFQICTLNQSNSTIKKRQEIGRGLRLPVNQDGLRVFDDTINRLVVIANESYKDFAKKLQSEYEEDCGVTFGKVTLNVFAGLVYQKDNTEYVLSLADSERIYQALQTQGILDSDGKLTDLFEPDRLNFSLQIPADLKFLEIDIIDRISRYQLERHVVRHERKQSVKLNKEVFLSDDFAELWRRIQAKTVYSVNYASDDLIFNAVRKIKEMPSVHPPKVQYVKAEFITDNRGVTAKEVQNTMIALTDEVSNLPDIVTYLQRVTHLRRKTIVDVLIGADGRLNDFKTNPQRFMDQVADILNQELNRLSVEGIQYEKLDSEVYEMRLFEEQEFSAYLQNLLKAEKSVYERISVDSEVEKAFAKELEQKEHIKLYVKLPNWFTIDTPIGKYNPDWAIVKEADQKVYFVRETKGTLEEAKLRSTELQKIKCGKKHFSAIGMENFEVVKDASQI
jgi:type III restriction enzyme